MRCTAYYKGRVRDKNGQGHGAPKQYGKQQAKFSLAILSLSEFQDWHKSGLFQMQTVFYCSLPEKAVNTKS